MINNNAISYFIITMSPGENTGANKVSVYEAQSSWSGVNLTMADM